MELKKLDFRRSDQYAEVLLNYYDLMRNTLDTADYVERKFSKKINKMLFKEFKCTFRQAKKNYRVAVREERKELSRAKNKALIAKLKEKFKRKTKAPALTPDMLKLLQNMQKQNVEG